MELRHLRYFVQVATDLHFARAAAHLGISQPPLSQQIRALEDELGVRLFDRTSRNVALTPAGRLFLDAAQATLDQAEQAVMVARRAAEGELGELAIGFNASAPFIPKIAGAIHAFRQTWPEVRLTLAEMGGPAQIEAVAEGRLDLGVLRQSSSPALPEALTATRLLEHKTVVTLIPVPRLQKDVNVDPFLTGAARDEALIKKHLSPLDYAVLNRFYLPLLGQSREARARQAEEALHWTLQLNEFADQMSVMKAAGTSEEELKKLKEEYYKLYMMRPK